MSRENESFRSRSEGSVGDVHRAVLREAEGGTSSNSPAIGVLLLNLGGPDTQEAVEPFLYNLFSDREIIQLPGGSWLQPAFARLISKLRGPSVRANYRKIGGGSPILDLTRRQAEALEGRLNAGGGAGDVRFRVGIAMRYWRPTTEEALRAFQAEGIHHVVALTLYPQYSAATTGSSLTALRREVARMERASAWTVTAIDRYPDHPGYVEAVAATVREGLERILPEVRAETVLLFSAHGLPQRFIDAGDPYVGEIARTRDAVLASLRVGGIDHPWKLGYQSRTGPVKWIGPSTDAVIEELAEKKVPAILMIPIAFVSDHIETLYEVDQLFAGLARRLGIRHVERTRMLNDDPIFIEALADLVRRHLQGA